MGKHHKEADGKYHINGSTYDHLVGSRAQVYHGTAYKTSSSAVKPKGDALTKKDLVMNKNGRIVSALKQRTAKADKRLEKHGYFAEKGKFGMVRRSPRKSRSKSRSKSHRLPHTVGGKTVRRR